MNNACEDGSWPAWFMFSISGPSLSCINNRLEIAVSQSTPTNFIKNNHNNLIYDSMTVQSQDVAQTKSVGAGN